MPRRGESDQFGKFVERENARAPFAGLVHGLGIGDATSVEHPTLAVQGRIQTVLESASDHLPPSLQVSIRELLMLEIGPFLRQPVRESTMSMLDIVTTGLTDPAQIKKYLKIYGIDLDDEDNIEYAREVLAEAVDFFNTEISKSDQKKVHPDFTKSDVKESIYNLFKTAAGRDRRILIPQACAILRIAAVIDFLNVDPTIRLLPRAEEEINRIVEQYFHRAPREEAGSKRWYFTTGPGSILPVERIEKRTKTRKRMLAKALHKPSNQSTEVVDHIGLRITTKQPADTLRLIYDMFFNPATAIFPGITIRIGETKNMLLNEATLIEALYNPQRAEQLVQGLAEDTIDHEDLTSSEDTDDPAKNVHTSKSYRAIHITFDLPLPQSDKKDPRARFPIEIQLVDIKSRIQNDQSPETSHESYVERQLESVRARVMGNNLETKFEELSPEEKTDLLT